MSKVLVSPTGVPITGTYETCPGLAAIANIALGTRDGGRFEFDYAGDTEMFWDDQRTIRRNGERVFLDANGAEWLESQLQLIDAAS